MPGLDDRNRREAELAAALLLLFQDYDDATQIDWAVLQGELEAILGRHLADTYRASFEQLRDQLELDLSDADLEQGGTGLDAKATDWADKYSSELAALIVANTQGKLQEQQAAGEEIDLGDQFDEARADRIAITETTRSITAGEFGVVSTAIGLGLMTGNEAIWQTAEDELVCEECAPLNGQPQDVWSLEAPAGPPLHVNCRCELDYQMGMLE
jgi:hypothetical protein